MYHACPVFVEGVGEWGPAESKPDGVWQGEREAGEEVCWAGEREGWFTSQHLVRAHAVYQWFQFWSWVPTALHILYFSYLTHIVQFMDLSLLMSWWSESGVLNKGEMQSVQSGGSPGIGLKPLLYTDINYILIWVVEILISFHNDGCVCALF